MSLAEDQQKAHWREYNRRRAAECKLCYQLLYEPAPSDSTELQPSKGPVEFPGQDRIVFDLHGDEVHEVCHRNDRSTLRPHQDSYDRTEMLSARVFELELIVGELVHARNAGHSHLPGDVHNVF